MSKLNKIKALLQSVLAQFANVSTNKGLISWEGDDLEIGTPIMVINEEGDEVKATEGDYTLEDGTVYVIDGDGRLAEIRKPEENAPESGQEMEEIAPEAPQVEEPAAEEPAQEPEPEPAEPENAPENEPEQPQEPENDPRDERIAQLEAEIEALRSENAELKAKMEEPAAPPATDQFDNIHKVTKTGNRGLDNLSRIINA